MDEKEDKFWGGLDDVLNLPCLNTGTVDNALKTYLSICSAFASDYLTSNLQWAKCAYKLLESPMFSRFKGHVRRRMYGRLRKEKECARLHLVIRVLLCDGQLVQKVFLNLLEEGLFERLVGLVREKREDDPALWASAQELLYEMIKIQKLRFQDLGVINDEFVQFLFELVEGDAYEEEPYHYPTVKVLLALNEQYMLAAHAPPTDQTNNTHTPTNKVMKTLCHHGSAYKNFGSNLIYLINREDEICLQLLMLKLLYLVFTTTATYEYFYTTDVRVLVDVIIRNLMDLPEEAQSLRHTYLRVLYPILNHSQLRHPPYHKREEIVRMLSALRGGHDSHFEPADETTVRLVSRCMTVFWLRAKEDQKPENPAHRFLGISLGNRGESSMSVIEVTAQSEKPGVMMPSRTRQNGQTNHVEIAGEA